MEPSLPLPDARADDAVGASTSAELRVEVVARPGTRWDEMASRFADAAYEQSVAYTASRWGARRLRGIVLRDARGQVVSAALAVVVALPLARVGVAHVKFGPLWRARDDTPSPALLVAALRALRRELGERRGMLVRVTPPADPDFEAVWPAALADAGFALRTAFARPQRYLVDLSLATADQLASFDKRWRAELRKASTELAFEESSGPAAFEQFLALFESMWRRKRFDDRHGLAALPALLAHPTPAHRVRIFVARHRGETVAASVVGGAGDTLHVLFGATADRALPLRAGYALRWWVLDRLRGGGARWLDLGGDEGDDGLRHYKERCVGRRGRIVSLPGEFDWGDRLLSRFTARGVEVVRGLLARSDLSRLRRQPSRRAV